MKHCFTDIHHHLLYNVDDGPKTQKDMAQMLRRAAAEGVGRIIATPHVTPGVVPCPVDQYRALVQEANQLCQEMNLDLRVELGAELLYTPQIARFIAEGRVPTLAGSDRVLVEFSPDVRYETLLATVEQILGIGYLPVLAHMERYRCLSSSFRRTRRLHQRYDVFFQVNSRSVLEKGFFKGRFVHRLLREGLVDAIASDAHNTSSRPVRMKAAWQAICKQCGPEYAHRLTSGALLLDE